MAEKLCFGCQTVKPFSEFGKHRQGKYGLRSRCRECHNAENVRYSRENPAKYKTQRRAAKYRARFNMTLDELEALHASVGYCCEACGTHKNDTPNGQLVLDHDHNCCPTERTCGGCIRGVLCTACNLALGALNDSLSRVEALADFVRRADGKRSRRIQAA